MSSFFDSASLVQIPSGYSDGTLYSVKPIDGTGDLTFSRGSDIEATRVAANGYIEKAKVNLLLQSNTYSTTWVPSNVSTTGGQAGYDGSNDAWLINITGGTSSQRVNQTISASGVLTLSVYAKAGTLNWISVRGDAPAVSEAFFNLATGELGSLIGSAIDSSIESVGSGWYRCSVSFVDTTIVRIYLASGDGNTTQSSGNIYLQDAQLNYGLVAQEYQETTTTSVVSGITNDMPRLDYSGGASCPSLLLEPSRTNAFAHSEYFGAWSLSRTSAFGSGSILNDTTSPEGVVNAAYIQQATGQTSAGGVFITALFATGTYTMSVFAKAKEQRYLRLGGAFAASGASIWCNFDLQEGVAGTPDSGITPKIEAFSNGWYRCSITATKVDTTGQNVFIYQANSSSGPDSTALDGLYIYGAMLESSASYPTSYIPTYGTSATRTADSCSKTGISSLIGQTEGTLFLETNTEYFSSANLNFSLSDGTTLNYVKFIFEFSTKIWRAEIKNNGSALAIIDSGVIARETKVKLAVGYANNDFVFYLNGTQIGVDPSGSTTFGATLSKLAFDRGDGLAPMEGRINQALVFKTRLTNAQLAELTA